MQKNTNRILSLLLALVMILSILPATVFAASEKDVLEGWSITLGDNIGVKFYLNSADYTVTTAVNGAAVTPAISGKVATVNVAAAQMTDTIVLTVKNGEEIVHTGEYSVRQYAEKILTGEYDDEVKAMVKEMLNYGAAAQTYFDYAGNGQANEGYVLETAATVPTEVPEITAEDNLAGIGLYGMSLIFRNKTAVRFYFTVSGDIADYTFKVGETAYAPVEKDGKYYVEIGEINPQDLDKNITVSINNGAMTVTYSPLNYIVRKYNNADSSAELKALVQAMYGYHLEALEYQKYLQIIQLGTMQELSNITPWVANENETFIDFNTVAYTATTGEYTSLTADAIKLVRGGEVYSVANPGQGLLIKESETGHKLKITPWGMTGNHLPIQAHDYFIVEGRFVSTSGDGTTIQIAKSYIYYDGTYVTVSATEPVLPTTVNAGLMQSHSSSHGDYGIYFSMDANAAPYSGWDYEYTQTSVDNLKLIRDGVETSIGFVGRPLIIKYGEADYYLKLEQWNVGGTYGINGGSAPITTDDVLIVEGDFAFAAQKVTMNITKSYVYFDGSKWVCSAEEPVQEKTVDVVSLAAHSNGWNSTSAENAGGMTFAAAENDAPFATNWSLRYKPVSSDVIKLIRDGVEYTIANTGADTIIKYSATEYYLEFWPFAEHKPMLAGDELIIEGLFFNEANNTYINVEKTNIILNADGTAAVIAGGYIDAGSLSNHSNGINGTDGIYATMTANSAPYDGWSIEYAPLSADSYYVIRGGEQINIGIPGRGTLVKYSDTEYYLKLTQWCTNNFAFTTSDIFVIEGLWKQNTGGDATLKIEKTYLYYDGSAWIFATELPTVVNAGLMQSHSNSHGDYGIYFSMDANAAPYSGWSYEYTQTGEDNLKLIRDGVETSIGIVGRPLIVKYGETDYYLKLEQWNVGNTYGMNGGSAPITTDDVLIVEGDFEYDNVTLNITKSYVYYDGSAWVCSAEAPVQQTIVDVVDLASHVNGWDASRFYFAAAENNAPYDTGWSLRYKPVSADVVKVVKDGVTTNVGNIGGETVVKYSATEYTVESWAIGSSNMAAGNIIILDGLFYNAANDVYIDVEKTYITFNADGTTTIINDADKYIDAGTMGADNGWLNNGFYFAMASNNLPYNAEQEDWSVEYAPTSTAAIKLIRNGVTTDSARVGAGTMVKLADGQCYMKIEQWTIPSITSKDDLVDGDILVVEGDFVNESNGYTLHIDKTYITFNEGNVIFSTGASTEFGEVLLPNSTDNLTIGMWNGSYHVFEHKQLQELQAAGITKIVGIDTQWIGTTDVNAWLDRVYSYGIRVVFDLRSWDGETVPSYASHPGVLGFLMYDEPSTQQFDELAALKAKFDAIDAFDGKLFYVNLLASCVADSSLFGDGYNKSQTDYDTYYVTEFLDKLDIQVLSWDNYSLISNADDTTDKGIRTDYFYNFEVMASKASDNLPLWYIMLSAGHTSGAEGTVYNTPTAEELRWQMAVALTYGVQNIDHYVYVSHADDYSSMVEYETWEPTALYYDIKDVNNEYLSWDNIFMAYDWVGVGKYSANNKDTMLDQLGNCLTLSNYGISSISASENTLVGVFEHNGQNAYMVTNAGSTSTGWFTGYVGDGREFNMADSTVTLTLDDADYKCVAVINNGEISYVAVNNNQVTLNVEAYEGVFVIPILN